MFAKALKIVCSTCILVCIALCAQEDSAAVHACRGMAATRMQLRVNSPLAEGTYSVVLIPAVEKWNRIEYPTYDVEVLR